MKDREISEKLGFSMQWVALWIGRYKKGGVEGLFDRPRLGAEPVLNPDQIIKLYSEIFAGPDPEGPLSRYRISNQIRWQRFIVNKLKTEILPL